MLSSDQPITAQRYMVFTSNIQMDIKMLSKIFLSTTMVTIVTSSKILLLPFAFPSHAIQFTQIGEELAARGHSLFILLPESYAFMDNIKKLQMDIITYKTVENDIWSDPANGEKFFKTALHSESFKQEFRNNLAGTREMCSNSLRDEKALAKMADIGFDLIIIDAFQLNRCQFVIPYRLGVPQVSMYTIYEPWLSRNPSLPSVYPFVFSPEFSERMTFAERLKNLYDMVDYTLAPRVQTMDDEFVRIYAKDKPFKTLTSLAGESLLWLIDTDLLLDYPRPLMPNEVQIGGLTTKPAKPLPADLSEFMDKATEGAIIVSFGTQDITMFKGVTDKLLNVLGKLPQKVIMRTGMKLDNAPSNVFFMSWLPQNDMLAHKNMKLFVSHCGANSQFEALYHGVPLVCVPMFGEQPYNAKRLEYHKFGHGVSKILKFTEDEFRLAMTEVLNDDTYFKNIKRASKIFRNRNMTPKERAVYWIEHVLEFGGEHLRSYALDMPWYQYLMFDILAFICILATVILCSLLMLIQKCFCNKDRKVKLKHN